MVIYAVIVWAHKSVMVFDRTVWYTDIPKISVLNQYRYIDSGYSTIPIYCMKLRIYRNFSVYRVKFTNYMAKP